jgi:pentatricopeptide repeat protein
MDLDYQNRYKRPKLNDGYDSVDHSRVVVPVVNRDAGRLFTDSIVPQPIINKRNNLDYDANSINDRNHNAAASFHTASPGENKIAFDQTHLLDEEVKMSVGTSIAAVGNKAMDHYRRGYEERTTYRDQLARDHHYQRSEASSNRYDDDVHLSSKNNNNNNNNHPSLNASASTTARYRSTRPFPEWDTTTRGPRSAHTENGNDAIPTSSTTQYRHHYNPDHDMNRLSQQDRNTTTTNTNTTLSHHFEDNDHHRHQQHLRRPDDSRSRSRYYEQSRGAHDEFTRVAYPDDTRTIATTTETRVSRDEPRVFHDDTRVRRDDSRGYPEESCSYRNDLRGYHLDARSSPDSNRPYHGDGSRTHHTHHHDNNTRNTREYDDSRRSARPHDILHKHVDDPRWSHDKSRGYNTHMGESERVENSKYSQSLSRLDARERSPPTLRVDNYDRERESLRFKNRSDGPSTVPSSSLSNGRTPDELSLNALIRELDPRNFSSLSEQERGQRRILNMVREKHPRSFSHDGRALTTILAHCARHRDAATADVLWKWMDDQGVMKNIYHFNAYLSVQDKTRNLRKAMQVLKIMKQAASSRQGAFRLELTEVTFSVIIATCEKCADWRQALELLDEMEERGVQKTPIAYNAAISACEKGMVPHQAHRVFERMLQAGIPATEISYCALISAAEKGGQYKLALRILEQMVNEKNMPYSIVAYSATISALAKGQQWRAALYLFRCLLEPVGSSTAHQKAVPKPNVVTYNATMTALEKSMQWEKALDLFDKMRLNQLPVTVVSYGSAISACDKGEFMK